MAGTLFHPTCLYHPSIYTRAYPILLMAALIYHAGIAC